MRASVLVDTGALLALLDARDPWHSPCASAFERLRLPLATSPAILTELFHLLHPKELEVCWSFLRSGAVDVLPIDDADLPALESLMLKYRDRPMDFADATLVRLAQRENLSTVFTVDNDDFETYRIGKRRFQIIPGR